MVTTLQRHTVWSEGRLFQILVSQTEHILFDLKQPEV